MRALLLLQDRAQGWHPLKITLGEAVVMLTDNDKINGLIIRAEIRVPYDSATGRWLTSVVVCQDTNPDGMVINKFTVWSVFNTDGRVHPENGIYDIADYGRALEMAMDRVQGRFV